VRTRLRPPVKTVKTVRTIALVALIALVAGLAGAVIWRSRRQQSAAQPVAAGALRGANVLLVTIDTLRADRVGAYGSPLGLTPAIDRLAREGLRVSTAYSHVPLTLPSHATIMTGLYPFSNGVRDNGTFRLDGTRSTLAKALKAAGYRTGAFVGAFVLDARFGLNAGFDVYDDRMLGNGADLEVVQRSAEQVLAPAADWILGAQPALSPQPRAPWLAWIHLYDPHEPYTPPEPYRSRYASDLYAGEIAYADQALGTFLDRLRAAGALDRTLVVVTSDHGESLGEHGERTHGLFAYDSTLRVPLVLWSAGTLRPGTFEGPARLVDIMPTVLDLLGVQPPAPTDGRSLRPFISGEQSLDRTPSYFEALNANLTRGWAPLKGVIVDRLKLIDLPIPELYDLSADPAETKNIYAAQPERARVLESALDRLASAATPIAPTGVDADAEARLRSLGYVVGSSPRPARAYTAADDPKRLVHLNAALDDAVAAWSRGNPGGPGDPGSIVEAINILRRIVKERPDLTVAYDRLAFMLRATGRMPEAVAVLDQAARAGHADAALLRSLGSLLRDSGDLQRSASVLEAIVEENGADLQGLDALGQTYTRMHRTRDAEAMFRRVLASSPSSAATWNNLGVLYLSENRAADAIEALSRAVAINPALAGAHNGLGVAFARQGDVKRAVDEWREALRIRPDFEDPRANLERVGAR
jgi:arylsulfatase A-like enzyme/Flp pilus assembly protein TadD